MKVGKLSFNKIIFFIAIVATCSLVSPIKALWQKKSISSYGLGAGGTIFAIAFAGTSKQCIQEACRNNSEVVTNSLSAITAFLISAYLFQWSYKSLDRRQGCLDVIMAATFAAFIASLGYGVAEVAAGKIRGLGILTLGTASGAVSALLAYQKFFKKRM